MAYKKRLAVEQAIKERGLTIKECRDACDKIAKDIGLNVGFNNVAIHHYISCFSDLSSKRLVILGDVLGVTNLKLLGEKFELIVDKDNGNYWLGEYGTIAKDFDNRQIINGLYGGNDNVKDNQ